MGDTFTLTVKIDPDDEFLETDETNNEVTIRCLINSVQANGFNINGFGIFNDDGTLLMHSEDTFTSVSKSSTDEIVFIIKDRLI